MNRSWAGKVEVGIFTLSLLVAGCASAPSGATSLPPGVTSYSAGLVHTLAKGETIWRLSETYGVSADTLLRTNHIGDPRGLKAGTPIWIPGVRRELRVLPYLPDSKKWQYIVVHHSATEVGNAELFDRGHRKRGFSNGLGYHFVIDNRKAGNRDGQIEIGHRWNHQMDGAHCNAAEMNQRGIGICLVGNFNEERVSQRQFDSMVWLVRQLQLKYRIPASRVLRHNDVPGKRGKTDCPGNYFPWNDFKQVILR